MQNCLKSFFDAPVNHLKQIRTLTIDQLLLRNKKYSQAYILMLISSLLTMLAFEIFVIVFFFTNSSHPCLNNITIGINCLSILYLIQSLIVFLCIGGSIGKTQSNILKVFLILFFTEIIVGFGFGGIGIAYVCILNRDYPSLIGGSFVTQNSFIQATVYIYLAFIALYLFIGPIFAFVHQKRQNKQKQANISERNCCDIFICIVHYTFKFLLLLTCIFVFFITILGPVIFFFCLVEAGRAISNNSSTQKTFFGLGVTAICAPMVIFFITFMVYQFLCHKSPLQQDKQLVNTTIQTQKPNATIVQNHQTLLQKPDNQTIQKKDSVLIKNGSSKFFPDDQYTIRNSNL